MAKAPKKMSMKEWEKIPDGQKDGQKTCSERDQGRFEKRTSHGPQGNEEIRQEV